MPSKVASFMRGCSAAAHIYVCGDAEHMAVDVQAAILRVIQKQGALSEERSVELLHELRANARYQRDVY